MFRTLETFLVKAAENLSNKIFCLGLVRQEKPSGRQEKPPGRQEKTARPPRKAARPGLCKAGPAWQLRNTDISRTDGTAPRPSVPSSPAEDGMSANDGRGRQEYRHRPSFTVTGRHRAVTLNTYTVTVERAVQDINRFIYISRIPISSKNSGSD